MGVLWIFGFFSVVMWGLMGLAFLGIQLASGEFDGGCASLGFAVLLFVFAAIWAAGLLVAIVVAVWRLATRDPASRASSPLEGRH